MRGSVRRLVVGALLIVILVGLAGAAAAWADSVAVSGLEPAGTSFNYDAPTSSTTSSANTRTDASHARPGPNAAPRSFTSQISRFLAAEDGVPFAERLFTNRFVGVDSKLFGHSYARGSSGLLNQTGSRFKFGWTSSGEFGGGWHLRLGVGSNPASPKQALTHIDLGWSHVPNGIANDLLDVIRPLNGLA